MLRLKSHLLNFGAAACGVMFVVGLAASSGNATDKNDRKFPENSTKSYVQYKIVHGHSRQNLEDNVNRLLRKDWSIHGPLIWMGSGYMQVMTVREWARLLPPLPAEPEKIE